MSAEIRAYLIDQYVRGITPRNVRHGGEDAWSATVCKLWGRAYRPRPGIDPTEGMRRFVFITHKRITIDEARKRKRHRTVGMDSWKPGNESRYELVDQKVGPSQTAEITETHNDLHAAVAALSPLLRRIVQLRIWRHLSAEQIARTEGVNPSTVRRWLHAAYAMLRSCVRVPHPSLVSAAA